jgi:hypothetical protein
MTIQRRVSGWVLVAISGLSACTTAWHPVPPERLASGQTYEYRRVLVVTRDGYERELSDATLRPDSLVGTRADSTRERLAFPVDAIVRLESLDRDARPAITAVVGFLAEGMALLARTTGEIFKCVLLTKC